VVQPALARAWLFRAENATLRDDADRFLQRIVREGHIARVLDRYFGFPQSRKQEEFEIFTERVATVLPRYRQWFQEAQERHGVEWRLLAAIAYQESHWNADATSHTGVRGIMQFTEETAKRYGVDRLDPYSSIIGGARYIAELKRDALAARIAEPDKTWLALAAYNIGIGHVENARILTQRSKKNPDAWPDVRRHLPLLTKPDIATQFKLGPCRCNMPVEFVEAVRAYYDVLLRLEPAHQSRLRLHGS
ncbi:MAG: transglycosylase SLT domain-containing protein, partial [Casimicrobium sp.]